MRRRSGRLWELQLSCESSARSATPLRRLHAQPAYAHMGQRIRSRVRHDPDLSGQLGAELPRGSGRALDRHHHRGGSFPESGTAPTRAPSSAPGGRNGQLPRSARSASGSRPRRLAADAAHRRRRAPQQWACCLALHEARRRLLISGRRDAAVEAIARDCGFRHMGRFAGYYGALFGELPSATLAR
ncbi:MAG TPA: helix-turn-helix domain-containing protein [Myxococcota bacterium]|nr:helix-turn-helix domain-containing protein [Myxococcota bacterium]